MKTPLLLAAAAFAFASPIQAETVKDREGAVRGDKARLENSARWNYNELDAGFAKARTAGKPLLVVLRCVPCLSCAGIDASVLEEPDLTPLLDQFVCVRVINANALDLSRFQFDYDLSFSVLLFNADGTLYGRYGSWQHQKDPLDKTTASFRKALEAALRIHNGYPGNRDSLAGKQGVAVPWKTPVAFPELAEKYTGSLDWNGKVVQSCVHCHMVGDAFRTHYRSLGQAIPAGWIYPQPSLETLGATLAADSLARVESVRPGTPAAAAGLLPGDDLTTLDGQPLVSAADVSWVLHRAPEAGTLSATVTRGGADVSVRLTLPENWRFQSDISRRVGTWPMRAMAFGGMKMDDLDDAARRDLGLPADTMALRIGHVGQYGPHAAAKKAGFLVGDILVEAGGLSSRLSESALIGRLLTDHRPGEKLSATVLRGTERVTLELPQQ